MWSLLPDPHPQSARNRRAELILAHLSCTPLMHRCASFKRRATAGCGPRPCTREAGPRDLSGPLGTLLSLLYVRLLFCFYVFAVVVNITH